MGTFAIQLAVRSVLWLTLQAGAVAMATMRVAFLHLDARDIIGIDDLDHVTAAHWLKAAPLMRAATIVWHAAFSLTAVIAALWLSHACTDHCPPVARLPFCLTLVVLTIVITGCMPWYLGTQHARAVAVRCSGFLYGWAQATRFLNLPLLALGRAGARLLGARVSVLQPFVTEDEDSPLAEISANGEEIEAEEHAMIKSIFEFGDTIVREIMTPRTTLTAVAVSATLPEAIALATESGHSRLPVYEDTLDKIIGVFYTRDALAYWPARCEGNLPSLKEIMRSPFFVPETKKVNELLREFRTRRTQLAIIVDEYGGTAGMVTLEDLLEEIVGDIDDEFDVEEPEEYAQVGEDTYELDGSLSVFDINDSLNLNLPEDQGYDTLAGFVMYKLGRLPEEGEELRDAGWSMKILKINDRRIDRVKVVLYRSPTS